MDEKITKNLIGDLKKQMPPGGFPSNTNNETFVFRKQAGCHRWKATSFKERSLSLEIGQ